jgi:hypothetical protein
LRPYHDVVISISGLSRSSWITMVTLIELQLHSNVWLVLFVSALKEISIFSAYCSIRSLMCDDNLRVQGTPSIMSPALYRSREGV